jgi:MoaA/NifB/PqqE/SkfB family radical SAM enzyme
MKGMKVIVTYKCNIMCSSCRYKCGPHKKGIMEVNCFEEKVTESYREGYRDYLFIEGGEPFLESGILYKYLKNIIHLKMDKYIVTNGYWGDMDSFMDILEDLKRVGLKGIVFEHDYFHSLFINRDKVKQGILKCISQGIHISFKSDFVSGDMKSEEDIKTFDFIKEMKESFKGTRFIFNDLSKDTNIFGRALLKDEKVILYRQ